MKKIIFPILGAILLCATPSIAQNSSWSSARPDGHAPISVMGDHYHKKGEFMVSYRYMPMWMNGNLSGSNGISNSAIFSQKYMATPKKMQMNMHMLGVMYAPSNNFTLMVMANYMSNSMDLKTKMGKNFTTKSSGFGDVSVSGLVKILNKNRQSLHANIGFSIPAGSTNKRGNTPMMTNAKLAYPMQMGSGTFDPFLGATYLGQSNMFSWGFQSIYKFRTGHNSANYTLGNRLDAVGWGAVKVSRCLSFSTSLSYFNVAKIKGADAALKPMMMPLFNTINSGRKQFNVGVGSNFLIPSGRFKNIRFAVEVKAPISQNVNGVQMKNKLMGTFGIQYTIGH